ncbi:MAG TPA: diguanylate cyclase, partial [Amycolatopsis sp.]|nr:diguanylate cyclase [Amycolatopsis sp.]
LPGTGLADATSVAERIRSATSVTPIRAGDQQIRVTVSGGCAIGPDRLPEDLVRTADTLLYKAKQDGRNRIVAAPA